MPIYQAIFKPIVVCILLLFPGVALFSGGPNAVHGIIHDSQHRPVPGAQILLQSSSPDLRQTTSSDKNGEFQFDSLPAGSFTIQVAAGGFAPTTQTVVVAGNRRLPVLHFQLEVAAVHQAVEVSGAASKLNAQSSTVETLVTPTEVQQTPGADQTNSLAMITDFTPGAYMVHDMLHMRGGHQVNWFFDGIPVINTNIAANVAPLINPKDVEELQIERGGFSSEYGDRTYGFFNVVTPSGFDMNNDAELALSAGNFFSTDDQLRLGGHTSRFAYYGSIDADRSELGLGTPVASVIHDQTSGVGGFLSLLYNPTPIDQIRVITSLRESHFQIPNTEDQQASGIRDIDFEGDDLIGLHWTHQLSGDVLFSLAPYFHSNTAHYIGGPGDTPFILDDNNRSTYFGVRSVLQARKRRHNARMGFETWAQHDNNFFNLASNPASTALHQTEKHWANSDAVFLEDQWKVTSWLTLDLGIRLTHYGGLINENAADPRVGGAIRIPRLNWILHGYYAFYYQPPPLDSISGPLLNFALNQGYGFIPLPGERDIQHDVGVQIPLHGWTLEVDNFHTSARNFLDHDVIGNSGIFIPLVDLGAIISGTEVTVRSPRIYRVAQLRLAYSNQIAQGIGPITGGLLEFAPPGNFLLDHDQRNTATSVLALSLPHRLWMTPAYSFGSGFLNADGPAHLPPHSTFDLSIGKYFGETWSIAANAVNIANTRYLLDTSNTFGGTHYIDPRQIYGELRYRFHF